MKKTGLFIGRFQPFHRGHKGVIEDISKEVDYLIIGIGSAEQHHTLDNPFTFKERSDMINAALTIDNYTIKPIEDVNDYAAWVQHVKKKVKNFDIVYTGNEIVKKLFEREGIEVRTPVQTDYVSATAVREMIHRGHKWEQYMAKGSAKELKKINGIERIVELYTNKFKNPVPTVDIIIPYEGGIVLIERKNKPYGWALPGGFLDYGESLETGAAREAKEETNLDVTIEKLHGVYSDPDRDERGHMISTVFIGKAEGTLKAGDDAANAKVFPLNNLPEMAFDHEQIIQDYLRRKK